MEISSTWSKCFRIYKPIVLWWQRTTHSLKESWIAISSDSKPFRDNHKTSLYSFGNLLIKWFRWVITFPFLIYLTFFSLRFITLNASPSHLTYKANNKVQRNTIFPLILLNNYWITRILWKTATIIKLKNRILFPVETPELLL